jgi:hypothetical protein
VQTDTRRSFSWLRKSSREEKKVKILQEETCRWRMKVVEEHNETICGKKKTFTRREESKDFGRGNSIMNEWRRQAQRPFMERTKPSQEKKKIKILAVMNKRCRRAPRNHSWDGENLHEKRTMWRFWNLLINKKCRWAERDHSHNKKKTFTRRKESEEFWRRKLVDNEWTMQTDKKRSFSWRRKSSWKEKKVKIWEHGTCRWWSGENLHGKRRRL